MLNRLRIRGKLTLVVALPLLMVALLTVPLVTGAMNRAARADDIRSTMHLAGEVASLIAELRQERQLSVGYLLEVTDRGQLIGQSARVQDRISDLRQGVARTTVGAERSDADSPEAPDGPSPTPLVHTALDAAAELATLREPVLARQLPPELVIVEFSSVITGLINALRLMEGLDLAHPEAQQVATLDASMRLNETANQALEHLLVVAGTGSPASATSYVAALSRAEDYTDRFTLYATPEQMAQLDLMSVAYTARDETGVGEMFGPDPYQVTAGRSAGDVFLALESLGQLGRFVETKVITDVLIDVEAQGAAERRTAYLVLTGAVLVVLAVVVLTALLARAVIRPLLGLTSSANRVAMVADTELARIADEEQESPQPTRIAPVQVDTRDELGDLARAFNRVQHTAVRLVERQVVSRRNVALMFGYLGRRTQNLVGRQLSLIDQLERDEVDPHRLADLYRLDHISSRLRRNAGSLVALSGSEATEEHVAPLPLTDVTRLALGEIEDYTRIDIRIEPTIMVAPAVVGDLVLVLAELMENAATFSPPHTRVTVTAAAIAGGAQLSIVDHGIGIAPERLAEENARLAQRERLDLAPSEVLGLFVVGRLARRHGFRVRLEPTEGSGVTARVGLTTEHLVTSPTQPLRLDTSGAPANGRTPAIGAEPVVTAPHRSPGLTPELVDVEALNRANRIVEGGQRWNAFAVPEPASEQPQRSSAATGTEPVSRPEPEAGSGSESGSKPEGGPELEPEPEPQTTLEPADPATESSPAGLPVLRRRVPGATLERPPETPPRRTPRASVGSDPDQARSLVEQLQLGVARALSEIQSPGDPHPASGTEENAHDDQ